MSFTDKELIISLLIFAASVTFTPRKFIPPVSVSFLLGFLLIYSPYSAAVFILSSLFTYFIFNLKREQVILPGIIFLVFIFLLFKIPEFGSLDNPLLIWGYPVGLSYFMVRHIHFLFEVFKENTNEMQFLDYVCYAGFFPAFFTGPIHRLPEFSNDLKSGSPTSENISAGFERILYGYVKIVFLSNYLVNNWFTFRIESLHLTHPYFYQYLDCIRYGANLYFQFSGYTDIAIGVSLIAGFKLKENFNFPFLAKNINEFWKRWHISLSDWCRDYVFKPVYANSRIFAVSILLTMLAIGLWHEFSLRYVIWALYHGLGIAIWQYFDKNKKFRFTDEQKFLKSASAVISVFVTVNFVILSFAITKDELTARSISAIGRLFNFGL